MNIGLHFLSQQDLFHVLFIPIQWNPKLNLLRWINLCIQNPKAGFKWCNRHWCWCCIGCRRHTGCTCQVIRTIRGIHYTTTLVCWCHIYRYERALCRDHAYGFVRGMQKSGLINTHCEWTDSSENFPVKWCTIYPETNRRGKYIKNVVIVTRMRNGKGYSQVIV